MEPHGAEVDMANADDDAVKELDEMKKRLKEIEDEAAALREMQAKVEKEMGSVQGIVIMIDRGAFVFLGVEGKLAFLLFEHLLDFQEFLAYTLSSLRTCGLKYAMTFLRL